MPMYGLAGLVMKDLNFKSNNNKGAVLIIITMLLPVFMLITGFVVDIGRAFLYKGEINKACMVAAEEASKCIDMEAAQSLGINKLEDNYPDIIFEYFYKNYHDSASCHINYLDYNVIGDIDNPKYIEVCCEANIRCFFLKIISIDYIIIHTKANGRLRRIK